MKQKYFVDGKSEDSASFDCNIDETFYVQVERKVDEIDHKERNCDWMILDASNIAL